MEKTIEIPEGYEARIEGNKVILEPKESEDDRIRKELLNAFQESEDSLYMVLTPHRRESFIAWLEKQGSQILANSAKTCKDEQNPTLPGFEQQEGVAGRDYIPVEWVEAIENYGKWRIVRVNEQNPAWSEEDEKMYTATIFALAGFMGNGDKLEWLKSLKERYTWKPSDEQMTALSIIKDSGNSHEHEVLDSLYYDLKKLIG